MIKDYLLVSLRTPRADENPAAVRRGGFARGEPNESRKSSFSDRLGSGLAASLTAILSKTGDGGSVGFALFSSWHPLQCDDLDLGASKCLRQRRSTNA